LPFKIKYLGRKDFTKRILSLLPISQAVKAMVSEFFERYFAFIVFVKKEAK